MKECASHELFVGAMVVWLHKPRGGYGYVYPVDAKIRALNLHGDRARIEVEKKDGSVVLRTVQTTELRWRSGK